MNITEFQSEINSRDGVSRANRFEVVITPPRGAGVGIPVSLLADSATLPGIQTTSVDYPLQLYRNNVKIPNGRMYEDIAISFILTNDYYMKSLFDRWVKLMISDDYLIGYPDQYETDVYVYQLDEKNKKVYGNRLINAYPITVNSIDLSNGSSDTINKLNVTFTYTDIEVILNP